MTRHDKAISFVKCLLKILKHHRAPEALRAGRKGASLRFEVDEIEPFFEQLQACSVKALQELLYCIVIYIVIYIYIYIE